MDDAVVCLFCSVLKSQVKKTEKESERREREGSGGRADGALVGAEEGTMHT